MSKKDENGKYYNEKQALYAKKYRAKFNEIKVRVPLGDKKEYQKMMRLLGYTSMNKFIVDAMNYYIEALLREREK